MVLALTEAAFPPRFFDQNDYQVVVIPMLTSEANKQAKKDREVDKKVYELYAITDEEKQIIEVSFTSKSLSRK